MSTPTPATFLCPSQTLIFSCVLDATRPTPRRDSVFSFVVVRYSVPHPALSTGFPPLPVPLLTSSVESLVIEDRNQFKVFDSVVELIPVFVVDAVPLWNLPITPFPNKNVFHSDTSLHGAHDAPVTLGGDVPVSTNSFTFRASFSHDCHSTVTSSILSNFFSPVLPHPAFLSHLDAFAQ